MRKLLKGAIAICELGYFSKPDPICSRMVTLTAEKVKTASKFNEMKSSQSQYLCGFQSLK